MSRPFATLLAIFAMGAGAPGFAADVHPQDFAYGMPVSSATSGSAYRFVLPVEVYTRAANTDLRDIRVFNARGEVVPYELRMSPPTAAIRPQDVALPLYPMHADAHASLNGLQVTIHSEGTALDLQTAGATPDPQVIASYIIDARRVKQPLSALQAHWAPGAPEFSGRARIECSDDLGSWRLVGDDAAVLHLLTGGSELIQNRIAIAPTRAQFWRLTWIGRTAPFELSAISAEIAARQPVAPQTSVTASGTRTAGKESERVFDLGARLPVTQVNLALPESNSVLRMAIFSRARSTDPWRAVTQGEFYRVDGGNPDQGSEAVRIATNFDRYWLVRQERPAAPIGDVKLVASWDAMDVVFLAQGPALYLLAYGSVSAGPSSVALEPLLKGITVVSAETGASYALGGDARLQPPPKTVPWRMAALWAALGFGVLLLAWIAYRLSKELGARPVE